MTFASVFQSSVFISWLRSSSMLVGRTPSQSTRILNFFFTALLRALEFAGEKIIHHQRCDVSGNAKILLGVIIVRVQAELVTAIDQPAEKFVHPIFFLVRPLAN